MWVLFFTYLEVPDAKTGLLGENFQACVSSKVSLSSSNIILI